MRQLVAQAVIDIKFPGDSVYLVPEFSVAKAESHAWCSAQAAAEQQVDKTNALGISILSPLDSAYPKLLAKTPDYPPLIWVKGHLSPKPEQSVAVIGPREPTDHGRVIAERIARFIAEEGWSVVSGLAKGCDAAAHQAALDSGGHTVAVLAHGLQMISPKENNHLAERIIAQGGALLSEFPIGSMPQARTFVQRDRTQAGMSQGVVMVQSDLTGGSLHASRAALNYDRWLAVPYPTTNDLANRAKKIQANLLLVGEETEKKTQLMRCMPAALERIVVLHSRRDYQRLTTIANFTKAQEQSEQQVLL